MKTQEETIMGRVLGINGETIEIGLSAEEGIYTRFKKINLPEKVKIKKDCFVVIHNGAIIATDARMDWTSKAEDNDTPISLEEFLQDVYEHGADEIPEELMERTNGKTTNTENSSGEEYLPALMFKNLIQKKV